LNDCTAVAELLQHVVDNHITVRLTQFEVVATGRPESALKRFLMSFHGLEDLFICLPDIIWEYVAPGAQNHIGTLKRLVVHPTRGAAPETDPHADVGEEADLDWFGWSVLRFMWSDSRWDLFGTSSAPGNLRKTLELSPERPAWTLLHLRRSGCITALA